MSKKTWMSAPGTASRIRSRSAGDSSTLARRSRSKPGRGRSQRVEWGTTSAPRTPLGHGRSQARSHKHQATPTHHRARDHRASPLQSTATRGPSPARTPRSAGGSRVPDGRSRPRERERASAPDGARRPSPSKARALLEVIPLPRTTKPADDGPQDSRAARICLAGEAHPVRGGGRLSRGRCSKSGSHLSSGDASPVIAVTLAAAGVRRYPELGTNWTFDKSAGPGDGLASKAHLAVGGRGRGNPQHLGSSRIARAHGV
jgi:hypothetical protein